MSELEFPSWWDPGRIKRVTKILSRQPWNRRARRINEQRLLDLAIEHDKKVRAGELENKHEAQYRRYGRLVEAADRRRTK